MSYEIEEKESPNIGGYSLLGSLLLILYMYFLITPLRGILSQPIVLGAVTVLVGYITASLAFRFASAEVKETFGVVSLESLSLRHIAGLFLLSISLGWVFATLFITTIETYLAENFQLSTFLVIGLVALLVVYPIFDFFVLSLPGESAVYPTQRAIEKIAERLRKKVFSPALTALILYGITYVIPIALLYYLMIQNWFTATVIWVVVFPLVTIGIITGAGIAEDLLALKLIEAKKPKEWSKLGFLSIRFRKPDGTIYKVPRIKVGKFILFLFGVQAVLTTVFFMGIRVARIAGIIGLTETVGFQIAVFTLLNKGRGAVRQFSGLWKDTGFKVAAYTLVFPVFLTGGVVLTYIFEQISSNAATLGLAENMGLENSINILRSILIIQNIAFLLAVGVVFFHPPVTSEKRLAWDAHETFTEAKEFARLIKRLKTVQGKTALFLTISDWIQYNPSEAIEMAKITLQEKESKHRNIELASIQALESCYQINPSQELGALILDHFAEKIPEDVGTKINLARLFSMIGFSHEELVSDTTDLLYKLLLDDDIAVRWEGANGLARITTKWPNYAAYAMGLVIKAMVEESKEVQETGMRVLSKIIELDTKFGQMAISVFLSHLREGKVEHLTSDAVMRLFSSILQIRPELSIDLAMELQSLIEAELPNERLCGISILTSLLRNNYDPGENLIMEVLDLVYSEHQAVKEAAMHLFPVIMRSYYAQNELVIEKLVRVIQNEQLGESRAEAVEALIEALRRGHSFDQTTIDSLFDLATKGDSDLSAKAIKAIYTALGFRKQLADDAFQLAKDRIESPNENVREASVLLLSRIVEVDPESVRLIWSYIRQSLSDEEFDVRVAAVTALGIIAKNVPEMQGEIILDLEETAKDVDWRVRLATASAMQDFLASLEIDPKPLARLLMELAKDEEESVREEAGDAIIALVDTNSRYLEIFYNKVSESIRERNRNHEVKASLITLLGELTTRKQLLIDETIRQISQYITWESIQLRNAVNQSYDKFARQFEGVRRIGHEVLSAINDALDYALKGANSSNPSMRRSAYEATVHLIKNLPPSSAPYRRGRKAILDSLNRHEKDPTLLQYLEQARILTTPLTE